MFPVGQDDVRFLVDVMHGRAEVSDCDHSGELVDAVVQELKILREAADLAKQFVGPHSIIIPGTPRNGLIDALRRAGRITW